MSVSVKKQNKRRNGNNIEKAFTELIMEVYQNNHEMIENQAKVNVKINKNSVELDKGKNEENNQENEGGWCCW